MFPLADINRPLRPPLVVKLLVVFNVLVFAYELLLEPSARQVLFGAFGFVPAQFWADPLGGSYQLFTSQFLHGGWAHIIGNMWFLWVFGDNVEDRLGSGRFILFYLIGGALAALAQGIYSPNENAPMIGASGAISAVMGAYAVMFPRARILTMLWLVVPLFFYLPAYVYLGYWALVQFFSGLAGGSHIAFWAHLGGFGWGLAAVRTSAFGPTLPPWRKA